MKKLILAVALFAASMGLASASTVSSDGAYRGAGGDPFGVPVFVRGGFNGWGLTDPMSYDPGTQTYSATVSLAAGDYEFKIASEDWSTVDFGDIDNFGVFSPPATVNVGTSSFGNLFLSIAVAGDYDFILDVSSLFPAQRGVLNGPFPLTVQSSVIPIPAAGLLLLSALGGLGFLRRRS